MRRRRRRRFTLIPLLLVGLFALYQYFTAEKITNPETGRSARVALSSDQEKVLGLQAYREVLSQAQTITSGDEYELVRRVARRLGPATGEAASDFDWEVSLVRSEDANAFCLPGGKIVVFTGILPIAQSEAGLAAVMGHEMAHATARHGSQRLLRNNLTQSLLVGVSLSLGDMDYQQRQMVMAALGAGATYGLILPFSRDHETEADQMGLARAGYEPAEAIAFWERMSQRESSGAQPPEFASTHPSHASRIAELRAFLPQARAAYEQAAAAGSDTGAKSIPRKAPPGSTVAKGTTRVARVPRCDRLPPTCACGCIPPARVHAEASGIRTESGGLLATPWKCNRGVVSLPGARCCAAESHPHAIRRA